MIEHPLFTTYKARLGPARYAQAYKEAVTYRAWLDWLRAGKPNVSLEAEIMAEIMSQHGEPVKCYDAPF